MGLVTDLLVNKDDYYKLVREMEDENFPIVMLMGQK